jgi:hypothetical protein
MLVPLFTLLDGTLAEAAEKLAAHASAPREKIANPFAGLGQRMSAWHAGLSDDAKRALLWGALGTAGGGTAGLLGNLASGQKKKQPLSNMLLGATLGGLGGAGAGYLAPHVQNLFSPSAATKRMETLERLTKHHSLDEIAKMKGVTPKDLEHLRAQQTKTVSGGDPMGEIAGEFQRGMKKVVPWALRQPVLGVAGADAAATKIWGPKTPSDKPIDWIHHLVTRKPEVSTPDLDRLYAEVRRINPLPTFRRDAEQLLEKGLPPLTDIPPAGRRGWRAPIRHPGLAAKTVQDHVGDVRKAIQKDMPALSMWQSKPFGGLFPKLPARKYFYPVLGGANLLGDIWMRGREHNLADSAAAQLDLAGGK